VTRAGPFSAEIILISDPEHAIPVQVNRTGARSIALGTGRSGLLSLPYLPQNTDVIVGDLLVSSGLGGVYPPGYPVGKVTAVTRDTGQPLLAVEAEPLAGLDRDPEVLLVWFDNALVEPEAEPEPAAATASAIAAPPAPAPSPPRDAQAQQPAAEPPTAQRPAAQSQATATKPADTGAQAPAQDIPPAPGEEAPAAEQPAPADVRPPAEQAPAAQPPAEQPPAGERP
jgi:rod shape-determining protein MreC